MRQSLSILFLFLFHSVFAQIQGSVVDAKGDGISWANVTLHDAKDSSIVLGSFTEEDGEFYLSIETGNDLFLQISFIGYRSYASEIFRENEYDFGPIQLAEEGVAIGELVIKAKRNIVERTAEGSVISVQGSLMTQGSSAMQVLERSPGVMVNRQAGNLQLNGSSGVKVFLDGRELKLSNAEIISYLEGMSGEQIAKIHILTSPSSKYGADGDAGVIVIETLKGDREPLSGNLSVYSGYGVFEKYGLSARIAKGIGTAEVYASYNFNRDLGYQEWTALGSENYPLLGGALDFDVVNTTHMERNRHSAFLGSSLKLKNGGTLGGEFSYMRTVNTPDIVNNSIYDSVEEWTNAIIATDGRNTWESKIGSIFYKREKLSVDFSGMQFSNVNFADIRNRFFDMEGEPISSEREIFVEQLKGDNRSVISLGNLRLDYESALSEYVSFDSGLNLSFSTLFNNTSTRYLDGKIWQEDLRLRNMNGMREEVLGAYTSWNVSLDSLTSLQLGLRYEYWDRRYENAGLEDQERMGVFPTVFVNRMLGARSSGTLSYVRRINRPTFNDLATTSTYNGPSSVFSGNPFLRAAITDRLKVGYSMGVFNMSVSGEVTKDPIVLYQLSENAAVDLFILSPQNMIREKRVSAELGLNNNFKDLWTGNLGLVLSRRHIELDYTNEPYAGWYNTFSLFGNQNLDFGSGWSVEVSGWMNGWQYDGSKVLEPFGMVNSGVRKEVGKNTFVFTVTDLFKTMKVGSYFGRLTQEAFDAQSRVEWRGESAVSRIFSVTYSYRISGEKHVDRSRNEIEDRIRIE